MRVATHAAVLFGVLLSVSAVMASPDDRPAVTSVALKAVIDPDRHHVAYEARYEVRGTGQLNLRLRDDVKVMEIINGEEIMLFARMEDSMGEGVGRLSIALTEEQTIVQINAKAVFEEDLTAEIDPGAIHHHGIRAHIGEAGIFLAGGSAWYPHPVDVAGVTELVPVSLEVEPIEGWALVASGNPVVDAETPPDAPVWHWWSPRDTDAVTLAGGRLDIHARTHETTEGRVILAMHVSPGNAVHAEAFLAAAGRYLDLYVPLLGRFPYERFTIVENFFPSGFAFEGFTLLGPQVVAMGSRALAPGYLDHELLHSWWGAGVYVDPADGNWAEGLTTYGANYFRRIADDGEAAGREYRRDIIMRLSTNPTALDTVPVDRFGRDRAATRFVGYEKAAFVFMMLEHGPGIPAGEVDRTALWRALRRFADEHLGRRAGWDDLRQAIEAEYGESREDFFRHWVRSHTVPTTPDGEDGRGFGEFIQQFSGDEVTDLIRARNGEQVVQEYDPDFRVYRVVPPAQIIPTIAGTLSTGEVRARSHDPRADAYITRLTVSDDSPHLLLLGHEAIREHAALIGRCAVPIEVGEGWFVIDGERYDDPGQAVVHTMHHPDHPGRFVTLFHANDAAGWSRLPMIGFYTRDTTVIWQGSAVQQRAVYEPVRMVPANNAR